jgi:hypothetical protein
VEIVLRRGTPAQALFAIVERFQALFIPELGNRALRVLMRAGVRFTGKRSKPPFPGSVASSDAGLNLELVGPTAAESKRHQDDPRQPRYLWKFPSPYTGADVEAHI